MKKTNKKAFTIVELVIVIAVIAILAAVLIPTFSSVIQKANVASDMQLIRNLNTALALESSVNGDCRTAYDAFQVVKRNGYENVTDALKSGYSIAYYLGDATVSGCFVLIDRTYNECIFPTAKTASDLKTIDPDERVNYFIVADTVDDSAYSIYAGPNWSETETKVTVNGRGFDAGERTDIESVSYENKTESAKNVVIRTNSFETAVSVDGALDTVTHYGQALSIDIIAVANASYHEKGEVKGNIIITAGHLDLSGVKGTYFVIVNGDNVKITRNSDTTVIVTGAYTVNVDGDDKTAPDVQEKIYYVDTLDSDTLELAAQYRGIGTDALPFLVDDDDDITLINSKGNFVCKKTGEETGEDPNYLTFTAGQNGSTIQFNPKKGTWEYSTNGIDWTKGESDTVITLSNVGDKVYLRGDNCTTGIKEGVEIADTSDKLHNFKMTGSISASGDVTSLTNGCGGDVELTAGCYTCMFYKCEQLTTAPALPSTTLAENCYASMFGDCTTLETAPALPATVLADSCYANMFYNCDALETAPKLPATTLAESCYFNMFSDCDALETAPELPATTLVAGCYCSMFSCTAVTTASITAPMIAAANSSEYSLFCENMYTDCLELTDICFDGTTEEWSTFVDNTDFRSVVDTIGEGTIHCTDGCLGYDGEPIE